MNAIDQAAEQLRDEIYEVIRDNVSAEDLNAQAFSEACFKAALYKDKLQAAERKIAALEKELNEREYINRRKW